MAFFLPVVVVDLVGGNAVKPRGEGNIAPAEALNLFNALKNVADVISRASCTSATLFRV